MNAHKAQADNAWVQQTGVGADGPAHINMDIGSGGHRWAKGSDGAAYVMPKWADRMAS